VKSLKIPQNRFKKLLLVEDNEDNQRLAKVLLTKAGFGVDLARNGEVAVAAAASFRYDGILMDIQMPVMDGFQATRAIRELYRKEHWPRIPIVGLTAHAFPGHREKCLQNDLDDYVTKPIKRTALYDTLENLIDPRPKVLTVHDGKPGGYGLEHLLPKKQFIVLAAKDDHSFSVLLDRHCIAVVILDSDKVAGLTEKTIALLRTQAARVIGLQLNGKSTSLHFCDELVEGTVAPGVLVEAIERTLQRTEVQGTANAG
jgi:CheY-like chemotaxis protein